MEVCLMHLQTHLMGHGQQQTLLHHGITLSRMNITLSRVWILCVTLGACCYHALSSTRSNSPCYLTSMCVVVCMCAASVQCPSLLACLGVSVLRLSIPDVFVAVWKPFKQQLTCFDCALNHGTSNTCSFRCSSRSTKIKWCYLSDSTRPYYSMQYCNIVYIL